MNCHEFKEIMSRSIGSDLDSQTRKQVGLHLTHCQECLRLISEDKFWDDAVIGLLDREAPEGLRSEILGDLADQSGLSALGWKKKLRLMTWGATRNNGSPWDWVALAGVVAAAIWLLPLGLDWYGSLSQEAFKSPGPMTVICDAQLLSPDTSLVTSSLSFEGRLF